jgi:hypothetical protein
MDNPTDINNCIYNLIELVESEIDSIVRDSARIEYLKARLDDLGASRSPTAAKTVLWINDTITRLKHSLEDSIKISDQHEAAVIAIKSRFYAAATVFEVDFGC